MILVKFQPALYMHVMYECIKNEHKGVYSFLSAGGYYLIPLLYLF